MMDCAPSTLFDPISMYMFGSFGLAVCAMYLHKTTFIGLWGSLGVFGGVYGVETLETVHLTPATLRNVSTLRPSTETLGLVRPRGAM